VKPVLRITKTLKATLDMSRSNLAEAVSAVDRCSDDEIRQLQALIAIRLGEGPPGTARRSRSQKAGGGKKGGKSSKTGLGRTRKGNPQRKSQYATHPVYKEFKQAKKAVEELSKEGKIPFKDVTGDARDRYDEALSNWIRAKCGFRASKTDDENSGSQPEETQKDQGGEGAVSSGDPQQFAALPAPPIKGKRGRSSVGSESDSQKELQPSDPPASFTGTFEEWNSLSKKARKRLRKSAALSTDMEEDGDN